MTPKEESVPKVSILGVPISRLGFHEAVAYCQELVSSCKGGYVCFANVHTVTEGAYHSELHTALMGAVLAVADGMPLVWTSRLKHQPIASRVCGPDFMAEFLKKNRNWKFGFIGGQPGQAQILAERLGVDAICYSPPMRSFSKENAADDWERFRSLTSQAATPRIIWIGLGAPKQELWMQAVSALAPDTLFFGVGAAFDFLTSTKKRAPRWMQVAGLEWFFRLCQEPKRLWRRYLVYNTQFIYLLIREWLT